MAFILNDQVRLLKSTAGIDATATASTGVFTAPVGRSYVITRIVVRCTAANGITDPATAQFERSTNPASGDLAPSEQWTALTVPNTEFSYDLRSAGWVIGPAETVNLNITVGATGTSQLVSVDVIGYVI